MSSIVRNSDDDPLVIAIQQPRIAIESVSPVVEEGAYPAKTESDRDLRLAARIFADGHEVLGAEVVWRRVGETAERRLPLLPEGNDFWSAQLRTPPCGRLYFRIEAWIDRFAGYRRELRAKHGARLPLDLELREGDELLQRCAERGGPEIAAACAPLAERLQACQSVEERVALWLAAQTGELLRLVGPREHLVRSREYPVEVERPLARFASWYELFPRSESGDPTRHGTFDDVIRRLPQIAAMGFDVLYFPPIHPIGRTHRKGRNNSLRAEAGDPGSPYAIGSEEGGHEAIHPELGDREDFRRLLVAVREHGMELALDFAIQCSPDHPWLREHPGWFAWRPDGSLRYAEKQELAEYFAELNQPPWRDCYRPNFFVNTPDINPWFLQRSGRPGFLIRAALATMGSGLWGMYSGFELCEAAALPGKEEYLDSEKYQLRPRDYQAPGKIVAEIARLNRIRRENPALQTHLGFQAYNAWNDRILYFGKRTADLANFVLVAVCLDPHEAQEAHFELPLWEFGLPDDASLQGEDLMNGHRWVWHGKVQWMRIEPWHLPFGIWRVRRVDA